MITLYAKQKKRHRCTEQTFGLCGRRWGWDLFFPFIFISWRLITLQYCSGFHHTLTWISHGFTYIPHPDPPSHLSLGPRTASEHVYYQGWNTLSAQAGCMRQVLRPGALGRPRGIGWRERWEGGSGWGIHVAPWLIHVNVWQNPLKCCEVISLQLIKINEKNFKN